MVNIPPSADTFNAIAERQRRQILEMLAAGDMTVGEITARLGIRQPAASKHLKILRDAGLVQVRVSGKQRVYALDISAFRPVFDWVLPFEQLWNERMDQLDDYLKTMQEKKDKRS